MDCSKLPENAIDKIMTACEGESKCTFGCQIGVEDVMKDFGPKVDCTEDKFTEEYIEHEIVDECMPQLLKALLKANPDYPCSLEDLQALGQQNDKDEVKEMICEGHDD